MAENDAYGAELEGVELIHAVEPVNVVEHENLAGVEGVVVDNEWEVENATALMSVLEFAGAAANGNAVD